MANRYWVNGNGTWDTTSTINWSATSGGGLGASAPTAADAVFFDALSGAVTITLGENVPALSLNMTGFTGTLAFGTNKITLAGNAATIYTGVTTATITGTPLIELSYAGATGTRTLAPAAVTEANSVSFSVLGGTDTVTTSGTNAAVRNLNFTGFSGTLTTPSARQVFGDLTLSSGMTVSSSASSLSLRGRSSGTTTITTAGKTLDMPVTIGGSSLTSNVALSGALTLGATRALTVSTGTFNAGANNVTLGSGGLVMSGGSAKTLTLGSGTWTCAGNWDASGANTTVSASTATIKMTSASSKSFSGGGKTWPTLDQAGAGALTISGSNTFTDITSTYTSGGTGAATITFTAATTQTVTQFTASGSSGNLLTLNSSSAGTRFTLSDASGTNSVNYCSITDSRATGGASWSAQLTNGNVDGGNNLGWAFAAPVTYSYSADIKLRSLAQRGRF